MSKILIVVGVIMMSLGISRMANAQTASTSQKCHEYDLKCNNDEIYEKHAQLRAAYADLVIATKKDAIALRQTLGQSKVAFAYLDLIDLKTDRMLRELEHGISKNNPIHIAERLTINKSYRIQIARFVEIRCDKRNIEYLRQQLGNPTLEFRFGCSKKDTLIIDSPQLQ